MIILCVVWVDRQLLTLGTPTILQNRDNLDIIYPSFDFFITALRHGQLEAYQPFQWAGTRLFGDPNFQINIVEIITGVLFGTKAIFVGLNFMWLVERITAALGMYALIGAICPTLPRYLRAMLSLLYVFSLGYVAAEAFPTASVQFATAPWLLFVLTTNVRLSNAIALTALSALLFVQFSYGQLQFTIYLGWLLLSFVVFYLPRTGRIRAILLLGGATCIATLLSAYYVVPLADNLFFGDGGPGGRVAQELNVSDERVPAFYLARLFVPQMFSSIDVPWWPLRRAGWSEWESFSAFQGVVLSILIFFGIFLRRVPLYFKITYVFISFAVTFRGGLFVLYALNLGTSVPYGRQTVLLGLIGPIIAAFALKEIAENRKIATAFAAWCGLWCVGLLAIYFRGVPEEFVQHAFAVLERTAPDKYHAGAAQSFYGSYAAAMQNAFAAPALLAGLCAIISVIIAAVLGRQRWLPRRTIAYSAAAVMCLLSLTQAIATYRSAVMRVPRADLAGELSIGVMHPVEVALVAAGARVENGLIAYRMHPDIYFGEHRQGTISVEGRGIFHLRGGHPEDNRFRTLPNFLASQRVPVTTGYSSLVPQAQRFTELMMWTPGHRAMERAIGDRTRLHPGLLEAFAIKWVLRHQPSLVGALQGRPDWSDDPWEQRFSASARLIYSDDAYRLYEYTDAHPAIDIPARIAFGTNAVATLGALEEIDKPWISTAALPKDAIEAMPPEVKSSIVIEHGQQVFHQSGIVLNTAGVAGHWMNVSVKTENPAVLLLGVKFDKWWSVRVNGRPAPLIRANDIFAAVQVPAGTSEVVVRLRPWSAWIGLFLSAATLGAILVGLAIAWYVRRRRRANGRFRSAAEIELRGQ
jgi:hypothetical protein